MPTWILVFYLLHTDDVIISNKVFYTLKECRQYVSYTTFKIKNVKKIVCEEGTKLK